MIPTGQLIIRPLHADLNTSSTWICRMDPYCYFTIGKQHFKSKTAKNQHKKPNWTDVITVKELKGEQTMHVSLYDRDHFSRDDFLCETMVNLGEIFSRGTLTNW